MFSTLAWILAYGLGGLVLAGVLLWTCLAIRFTAPLPKRLRVAIAISYGLLAGGALLVLPERLTIAAIVLAVFLVVWLRFLTIRPRIQSNWRPEVATLPSAHIEGDELTVHNLRQFVYRSVDDFDVRHVRKTFHFDDLKGLDLIASYWTRKGRIAHTMLSWDFGGADPLCLSVEVRREYGKGWGALPGLFKQYELIYVLGDERDLVRLRTHVRDEDVYLFRTAATREQARRLLEEVLEQVNRLSVRPEFYRTIGRNCTTSLVDHVNAVWPNRVPVTRKILMNGYAPEAAYEQGLLGSELPFEEYKERSAISERAKAGGLEDFSRRIRGEA